MAEAVAPAEAPNPADPNSQEAIFNKLLEQAVGKYGVMQLQMGMQLMSETMNEAKQDDG